MATRHFELPADCDTDTIRAVLDWFSKATAATSEQFPGGDWRWGNGTITLHVFCSCWRLCTEAPAYPVTRCLLLPFAAPCSCQMVFPPGLTKDTRKLLHIVAQGLGLPTFSKVCGCE